MKASLIFVIAGLFWLALMMVQPPPVVDGRPFNFTATMQDYLVRMMQPFSAKPKRPPYGYDRESYSKEDNISQVKFTVEPHCRAEIIVEEARCFRKAFDLYQQLNGSISGDLELGAARASCCLVSSWFNCTKALVLKECGVEHEQKFINHYYSSKLYEEYVRDTDCSDPDDCQMTPWWRLILISVIIGFSTGLVLSFFVVIVHCLVVLCIGGCGLHGYDEEEEEEEDEEIPMRQFPTRVSHL